MTDDIRVIAFTGLPGTGKSTLAECLAREIGAPVFNGDWLMGALKPAHQALSNLDQSTYLAMYYNLIETLITRQLMFGQSAVIDDILDDQVATRWQELARSNSAELYIIECTCTNRAEHRKRLEGRQRGIPGWHEIGWDHVERMSAQYPPLTIDRLVVDAMEPVPHNIHRVHAYISSAQSKAPMPGH